MGKEPKDAKPAGAKPAGEKPAGGPAHHAPAPVVQKGGAGAKVGCLAVACKDKDTRFNFCEEHFRQFKFGLITKTGEKVLDYEKKFDHYQAWLRHQQKSAAKVG